MVASARFDESKGHPVSCRAQVVGRVPLPCTTPGFTRWAGYRALDICRFFGAAAAWDAALGVTLNVADISALADQTSNWPRPWDPIAYDVSQGTGANQPLYIGATAYNGQPSIQFTAANSDSLSRAATNLFATLQGSVVSVQKFRAPGGDQALLLNGAGADFSAGLTLYASGTTYFANNGAASRSSAGLSSNLEVWSFAQPNGAAPTWLINGVALTLAGAMTALQDPTGAASIMLGRTVSGRQADIDLCFLGIFQTGIPNSVLVRISHALGARFGVAA